MLPRIIVSCLFLGAGIAVDVASAGKIIPGRGIDDIRFGMHVRAVVKRLGGDYSKRSFDQEHARFSRYGYQPCEELQFFIGFNYLYVYTPEGNRTNTPIWKLYFKDDRLIYMILSNFIYPDTAGYSIDGRINFNSVRETVIQGLGMPELEYLGRGGNLNLGYFRKGIKVMLVPPRPVRGGSKGPQIIERSSARARAMHLFRPLTPARSREYQRRVEQGCQR